jgi:peptide/nickel transport system substrate-binding protein
VKESGYDGRPIVVLHITDIPFLNAAAIVTRQRLETIGFKVILKAMDWSTNLVVRARKEPPEKGGWNLLHTWWPAAEVINPAVHFGVSGAGARAWFGWPDVPQLEKLVTDWVRATDQTKRKQLADEVQKVAFSEVTYVPWGEWVQPMAFRRNVQDVLKFVAFQIMNRGQKIFRAQRVVRKFISVAIVANNHHFQQRFDCVTAEHQRNRCVHFWRHSAAPH